MSHHSIAAGAASDASSMRWRVVSFSVLGVLILVVLLAVAKPHGLLHDVPSFLELKTQLTWRAAPTLVFAGLCAGLLAGMLGMGGGVLKISFMLLLLRFDFFFARAVSLITMFFSSASALRSYWRAQLVVWPLALRMLVIAVPAGLLATVLGNDLPSATLKIVFAVFLVFLAFNTLALVLGDPHERTMRHAVGEGDYDRKGYVSAVIGTLHGFACGLLGISGGVIGTPMQQVILQVPLRQAIANTLVVSTAVTGVASVIVAITGVRRGLFTADDILFVDLFMGAGAMIGAPLGAKLGARFNATALRLLFVVLTLAAGLSILF